MKIKNLIFSVERFVLRLFDHRHIWLISDRAMSAGDNGEAFFRYMQGKPEKCVFAIRKESEDYERLRAIGPVVEYESPEYKSLLCSADCHISSQLIHMENHKETPQIFLQHGVAFSDISPMINNYGHKNFHIVVSGTTEYESFLQPNYKIDHSKVWLTGLPRFDYLSDKKEKLITVAFTWRKNLVGISKTEFENSEYCKNYQMILNNERINSVLKKYGYKLKIKIHPEMKSFLTCFKMGECAEIWDASYNEVYRRTALFITDYSSCVSDFLYLKKPVIYYQPDLDAFWNGELNYCKGYFEYERDGFGPVTYSFEELIAAMEHYLSKGCEPDEMYLERIEKFYKYNDQENCKRVYENIKNVLEEKSHSMNHSGKKRSFL